MERKNYLSISLTKEIFNFDIFTRPEDDILIIDDKMSPEGIEIPLLTDLHQINDLKEKLKIEAQMTINGKNFPGSHQGNRTSMMNKPFENNPKYELLANGYGTFSSQGVDYEGNFTHNFLHDHGVARLMIQQVYKYEGSFRYGKKNGWGTLYAYFKNLKEFKVLFSGVWRKDQPVRGFYYTGDRIMRVENRKIVPNTFISKKKVYVITHIKVKECQLLGKFELINLIKSRKADKQAKVKEIENEKSNLLEETNDSNILSEEIELNEGKDDEQIGKNMENLIKSQKFNDRYKLKEIQNEQPIFIKETFDSNREKKGINEGKEKLSQEKNICDGLLQEKLRNPNKQLTGENSILLLLHCIKKGDEEAIKAKGKEIVIFIGNTGSGKSTTINFIYGCSMVLKNPKELGEKGLKKLVVVLSKKDGGSIDEIMKIGHSKESKTFMPQVEHDKINNLTYVDCPGFLDNRGAEINIANAVNIKNSIQQSKSVKVIMLINYHTLAADRGRGLKDMLRMSSDLFGSIDNLLKNRESILIGVTNSPDDLDLENLKEWLLEGNQECMNSLADCIFLFDPVKEAKNLNDRWSRMEIISKIKSLKAITNHNKLFKTVLTDEDEKKLMEISDMITKKIDLELKNDKNVDDINFSNAAKQLSYLHQLSVIEHVTVDRIYAKNQNLIERKFQDLKLECLNLATLGNFDIADQIFLLLQKSITYFDESIQKNVNFNRLLAHIETCKAKKRESDAKEENNRQQLKMAQNKIDELIKLLNDQKLETESQLSDQKKLFEHMQKEQKDNLELALKQYDKERKKLEEEINERLKKKDEEMKIAKELNQKEIQQQIEEEKKRLMFELEDKSLKIKAEKQNYEQYQMNAWIENERQQQTEIQKLKEKILDLEKTSDQQKFKRNQNFPDEILFIPIEDYSEKQYSDEDMDEDEWENPIKRRGSFKFDKNGDLYDGEFANGLKTGKGTYKCAANRDFYVGHFKDDKREGNGKLIYGENGDVYEGDWKNDKREGNGTYKYAINGDFYDGSWKNDKKEGEGRLRFCNGDVYEGDWKNDKKEGRGRLRLAESGNFYEGDWKNDEMNGRGIFKFALSGDFYDGEWKNNKREGKGKYIYFKSGNVYDGEWRNDKKEGKGKLKFAGSGNLYEGDFKNNKMEGNGRYTFIENKNLYEGEFKDNRIEGRGIFRSGKNGNYYEGEWKNGKRDGKGFLRKVQTRQNINGTWKNGKLLK